VAPSDSRMLEDNSAAPDAAWENGEPERRRILYIYPDTMGLHRDPRKNPLHYLSRHLEGDFVAVWIVPDDETARRRAAETAPANGRFRFHWTRRSGMPGPLQRLWQVAYFAGKGLTLSLRHGRYDAIVVYGPFRTALAGLVLRELTGTPLIVEFPGHPFRNYDLYEGRLARLKRRVAPAWTRFVARRADHVRLLFPWQIDDLGLDVSGKTSTFHNFTTVNREGPRLPNAQVGQGKYVLFLGFPFHLKGVDVLIRAFNRISPRYPDYRLLVVGHCPDPEPYRAMAEGNDCVRILPPVPHDEAMALMAGCSVFALASRIEGMARVLIEAMGAGKPVISSAVGGIPHYIQHGSNGLLFESENVEELAAHLDRLLGDEAYAAELAKRGQEYASTNLSEDQYALKFRQMIDRVAAVAQSSRHPPLARLSGLPVSPQTRE
jgi:glycosyltransferase involved in cell wall biosynthesis